MTYDIEFTEPHVLGQGRTAYAMMILSKDNPSESKLDRLVYKDAVIVSDPKLTPKDVRFILCELVGRKLRELADFIEKNNEDTIN